MRLVAIGTALALSLLSPGVLAQPAPDKPAAEEPAQAVGTADVLVLHATNDGKGISDKIRALPYQLPQLEKPPLSAYDSYELLENKKLPLKRNDPRTMKLPDSSTLGIGLEDVLAPSKPEGKSRYALRTQVTKPSGKQLTNAKVTAEPKVFFFVAGPAYQKGILVIGIRVLPKK
ncbi:MAG: hypothetical protein JRI23_10765 [Deltaproteobacteria bacterium]|jgi:hypothetical protein|nr:hypothetical protein [Deltaproteobacteria bacterium]MBW2532159.1 hypothetical protein [Deltaproteobacteria bacterium]